MSRYIALTLGIIVFSLTTPAGALDTDSSAASNSKTQPSTLTRFPGPVIGFNRHSDDSLICVTPNAIFKSSVSNPKQWVEIQTNVSEVVPQGIIRPVGGDEISEFFTTQNDKGWFLIAINLKTNKAEIIKALGSGVAAFSSHNVGVIANRADLWLTTDSGKNWTIAASLPKRNESIVSLAWKNDTNLLVGGSDGSMQYLKRENGKFRRMWDVNISESVDQLTLDDDYVWVGNTVLYHIKLASGKIDTKFKSNVALENIAVCPNSLLICNWSTISIWERDKNTVDYKHVSNIQSPPIITAVPIEQSKSILFSADGQGQQLDLQTNKLFPFEFTIRKEPTHPKKEDVTRASQQQLLDMVALSKKVSRERREAILSEANKKNNLTPRQRVEWAIEQLKKSLEENK
jgi:hypothetical protein